MLAWRRAQRPALLAARESWPIEQHRAASAVIATQLQSLLERLQPHVLGGYWPIRKEFNVLPLLRARHAAALPVALPVVTAPREPLEFRLWLPGARMSKGVYDIPYPADGAVVHPDVLVLPMVGFDPAGYRLGYGGGYYDRTAAQEPRPRLIGIAFEQACLPTIHPLAHDVPMDWIISEQRVIGPLRD